MASRQHQNEPCAGRVEGGDYARDGLLRRVVREFAQRVEKSSWQGLEL